MARKPVPPDEHRQRPLEPPENAEFRDMRDERAYLKRLRAGIAHAAAWAVGVGTFIALLGEKLGEFWRFLIGIGTSPPPGGGP